MDKFFYISTPIYYPSAKPHMGHAYSSIIADFFARFKRMDGHKVFFLTGTDEHGLKIQRAAENRNKDTLEFCNELSETFKDLSKILNLTKMILLEQLKRDTKNLYNICGKNLKKTMIFIFQIIQVGTLFQMKLFIMKMK